MYVNIGMYKSGYSFIFVLFEENIKGRWIDNEVVWVKIIVVVDNFFW